MLVVTLWCACASFTVRTRSTCEKSFGSLVVFRQGFKRRELLGETRRSRHLQQVQRFSRTCSDVSHHCQRINVFSSTPRLISPVAQDRNYTMARTKHLREFRSSYACNSLVLSFLVRLGKLTVHSTRAANKDAVMLDQPTCHGNRLVIIHSDSIVDELSAYIEIMRNSVDAYSFDDRVNLMTPPCSFSLLGIEHDSVLDAVE